MAMTNLLSNTARVETPFIGVRIGEYTFGIWEKNVVGSENSRIKSRVRYPNYTTALQVYKVNGAVNTYTLTMKYVIRYGDDPNFLEKVFSSVQKTRDIYFSYGDLSAPAFIYKEEKALITRVRSRVDINTSTITYTINAVSTALTSKANKFYFPKTRDKGSNIIRNLLYDQRYGLLDIFYGMRDVDKVNTEGLIAGGDREIELEEKTTSVLDYLNYVVNCMSDVTDTDDSILKKSRYTLTINDDITNGFEGPYFKVSKVSSSEREINSLDTYEIDIGYPGDSNAVISFTIEDDETYSILYNYSQDVVVNDYIWRIDNNGNVVSQYSPSISESTLLRKTTEIDRTWWSQMTQYPIKASITIKGLLRPAILMNYIKLNTYFYGQKHISSGNYIITKQVDDISESGYRTILSLTRVSSSTL